MVKSYTFEEKNTFSKIGTNMVSIYLKSLKKTVKVENVEENPEYQKIDIDLIWVYKKEGVNISVTIEVKSDNYTSGNFWLETISNKSLGTLGCFIKSKAKYVFYYFPKWDCVYVIPLKAAIPWFKNNLNRFIESETSTKDQQGNYQHTTIGRLVPIDVMMVEVKEIKLIKDISKKVNNS